MSTPEIEWAREALNNDALSCNCAACAGEFMAFLLEARAVEADLFAKWMRDDQFDDWELFSTRAAELHRMAQEVRKGK